jgi:hypothetical protein
MALSLESRLSSATARNGGFGSEALLPIMIDIQPRCMWEDRCFPISCNGKNDRAKLEVVDMVDLTGERNTFV